MPSPSRGPRNWLMTTQLSFGAVTASSSGLPTSRTEAALLLSGLFQKLDVQELTNDGFAFALLIIIRQINHLMKIGHPITNGPATFGLDVDIDNESLFEKIVIGFAYLMLDALLRQIRRIN